MPVVFGANQSPEGWRQETDSATAMLHGLESSVFARFEASKFSNSRRQLTRGPLNLTAQRTAE